MNRSILSVFMPLLLFVLTSGTIVFGESRDNLQIFTTPDIVVGPGDSAWAEPPYVYVTADSGSTELISRPILLLSTNSPVTYQSYVMGGPSSFVSVYPPSGFTNDSLQIVLDPTGLEVGYHDDTVVFNVVGISEPVRLGVTLKMLASPVDSAWADPPYVYVTADSGSTELISRPILLWSTNSPAPYQSYVMGGPSSFVSVYPPSGITNDSLLQIVLDPTGLEVGYHDDTVVFEVDGVSEPVLVGVTLDIISEPVADSVWLSDDAQYFTAPHGVDFLQYGGVMVYSSEASVPFSVSLLDDQDMVYLIDTSSSTNDMITFGVRSTADMPAGLYVDTLLFTFEGDFDPLILIAHLLIHDITDSAWVEPSSLYHSVESGSASPIHDTLYLFSTNAPALYESYVLGGSSSFVSISDSAGTTDDTVMVEVDFAGLDEGTYADTVVFNVSGIDDPVLVTVTLDVTPENPTIAVVTPATQDFFAESGVNQTQYGSVFIDFMVDTLIPYSVTILDERDMVYLIDSSGMGSDSVRFEVRSTASMPAGLYVDTLAFYLGDVFGPPLISLVYLSIDSATVVDSAWAEPSYLHYSVKPGSPKPFMDSISLFSSNAPAFYEGYVLGEPYRFVSLPDSGRLTDDTVQILIDPRGLKNGTYTNTIIFDVSGVIEPVLVEVELEVGKRDSTSLDLTCSPNPFNPRTEIRFRLPGDGHVKLEIYDILGRKITTLVNGPRHAGDHAVTWNASDKPSGIYLYRLQAGDFVESKKMLLLK